MKKFLVILFIWALVLGGAVACKLLTAPSTTKFDTVEMPFIFWGGDVATFRANGGPETAPDSLFGKQGLKIKLVPGDDFPAQVKNYQDKKTPFLRGTLSMLAAPRAKEVRQSIVEYARLRNLVLEEGQLRHVGVGVTDPKVPYPADRKQKAENRRVQFMIVKVPAGKVDTDEFK